MDFSKIDFSKIIAASEIPILLKHLKNKPTIQFGTWEGKPIEWIVLKRESFGILIFSKLALFSLNPNNNGKAGTWTDSGLRHYLNGEFYDKAFTENEKKKIINCFLKEPESTKDDVFLLSYEEANTLMTQDERKCGNGSWCNGHSCQNDCYKFSDRHGTCVYLRTPQNSSYMWVIHPSGTLEKNHDGWRSIRPAMWIREK